MISKRLVRGIGFALVLIGGALIGLALLRGGKGGAFWALPAPLDAASTSAPSPSGTITATPSPTPTNTPQPLVPTRTAVPPTKTVLPTVVDPTLTSAAVDPPTAQKPITEAISTPTPSATPTVLTPDVSAFVVPRDERHRLGVSLPEGADRDYDLAPLEVGWVMDWNIRFSTSLDDEIEYAQTVRLWQGTLYPGAPTLTAVAAARPGSLWLISNEPDVRWQDNTPPDGYAVLYHEAYEAIKAGDPSAVVAVGGISQPTELRLRYLDLMLETYRTTFGGPLPADAWHIHNYMLREERDSWGVDIPPGLPDDTGMLYGIDDSTNLELFRAQILSFRRWMQDRGYGDLPLVVSEFGVPMPPDYGFPPDRVGHFLRETWRFFLSATDPQLGLARDGGRLVQQWCWFSLGDANYPAGDLIDTQRGTGDWTPLALVWMEMVGR